MKRFTALLTFLMMVGCLRPVWTEVSPSTAARSARNGITPPPEPADDGTDRYRVSFEDMTLVPWRVALIGSERSFVLGCTWQGIHCLDLLPDEARESLYLRVHTTRRTCPSVRIFRDDEEIPVVGRFRWSCVFVLDP